MRILVIVLLALMMGCAGKKKAMKKPVEPIQFEVVPADFQLIDDASAESLAKVLQKHISYWSAPIRGHREILFGKKYRITADIYVQHLVRLNQKLKTNKKAFAEYIKDHFVFLAARSEDNSVGDAFFTSYFEPVIAASTKRDDRFWQPLYAVPEDMVVVDMGAWARTFPRWSVWEDRSTEKKSRTAVLRGRLKETKSLPRVVPYYSRREIDEFGQIQGRAEVIAYLDPIDSFFLQIQGSGALKFSSGRTVRVGYAAQNGHPYTPIGKYMFDVIPRSMMSLQSIEAFLRRLSPEESQSFLNLNASYVFFRKLKGRGETFMGTEVVDGRTIATDTSVYPKGTLAYISIRGFLNPHTGKPVQRFVMDQDTGGAIRGPGRVDLFWGQGDEAKEAAGGVKHSGQLFHLFPKSAL